ncbi:DUF6093 family protein [Streptomyces sp. NPDC001404]|uniref:DUF6093 family protein n=1 Tax=Streptomyces sp. NPDC001404 TaxID=3364571 RepID=UPI0036856CED
MTPPLDLTSLGAVVQDLVMADTIRIARPAPPVLNPQTGELEHPAPTVVYQGPGAVLSQSAAPGLSLPVAGQPWADNPTDRYRLLTPITAPVAARDDEVSVVSATYDPALLGRAWRCLQPGQASTLVAVRVTWLDEKNGSD